MARRCEGCGAAVPWGTPQCLQCGARTVWWRALSGFGILVGVGTALVVAIVIARVWLLEPPPAVQMQQRIGDFLARAGEEPLLHGRIAGAGRCREPAGAMCVQVTAEFAALAPAEQKRIAAAIEAAWAGTPVRLVSSDGRIIEEVSP